uniref:Uncharacterized protein n=1 Tax=Pseudomonas aeruginosa TaxID=287 RepID=A0A6H1Q8J6_PSEAI|nr:Hypothetical protein [Pseudomonas aeruginosa]
MDFVMVGKPVNSKLLCNTRCPDLGHKPGESSFQTTRRPCSRSLDRCLLRLCHGLKLWCRSCGLRY